MLVWFLLSRKGLFICLILWLKKAAINHCTDFKFNELPLTFYDAVCAQRFDAFNGNSQRTDIGLWYDH